MQLLPKGKASGLDGMIAEVILVSWSFLQADYLAMIFPFWSSGILPYSTIARVMKIVPKKADKHRLKDCQPLTMLPIVYKLIAKLLAIHFSPHSRFLINP